MKIIFFVCLYITIVSTNHVKFDDLSLKKCEHDNKWSIHGWWPEYSCHSYPSWCNSSRFSEFNLTKLEKIIPLMTKYWYSCPEWSGTSNTRFWQHEWEKHGTCINDITMFDYFYETLQTFMHAKKMEWFDCCQEQSSECLIPFSNNINDTHWLGWCRV